MADIVTVDKLNDGFRNAIFRLTNVSDGTGETLVVKVDQSLLLPNNYGQTPNRLRIDRIEMLTDNMAVRLFWGGSPNIMAVNIPANFSDTIDFWQDGGGLNPPAALVSPTVRSC